MVGSIPLQVGSAVSLEWSGDCCKMGQGRNSTPGGSQQEALSQKAAHIVLYAKCIAGGKVQLRQRHGTL